VQKTHFSNGHASHHTKRERKEGMERKLDREKESDTGRELHIERVRERERLESACFSLILYPDWKMTHLM
jgi:hypothetical protein